MNLKGYLNTLEYTDIPDPCSPASTECLPGELVPCPNSSSGDFVLAQAILGIPGVVCFVYQITFCSSIGSLTVTSKVDLQGQADVPVHLDPAVDNFFTQLSQLKKYWIHYKGSFLENWGAKQNIYTQKKENTQAELFWAVFLFLHNLRLVIDCLDIGRCS